MKAHIWMWVVTVALWALCTTAGQAHAQAVEYLHTDALGSVVAVTNSAGQVIERREYEPYGRQLKPAALADVPGYTGHVSDAATGLDYMQQRYYDPMIGRFLSTDPVTADSATGANFNRYWYANNNPYKFVDPDGRVVQDRWKRPWDDPDKRGPFDSPCGRHPVCLSAGDGGGTKQDRSPEEEDYYAQRAQMVERGKETFREVGIFTAKEAGQMFAFAKLGKLLGGLGRFFGKRGTSWVLGAGKSEARWAGQMERRGWTSGQITEAIGKGKSFPAENLVNKGNSATRYVHPETGRSVVVDDVTREVIHVGGNGFRY